MVTEGNDVRTAGKGALAAMSRVMRCRAPRGRGLRRRAPRRRSFTTAMVAAMVAVSAGSCGCAPAPPPPTPKYGTGKVCFQAVTDIGYGPFVGIYTGPVNVDALIEGSGQQISTVETSTRGCITMKLVAGYSWRFRVYSFQSNYYWVGRSTWKKVRSGGTYDYGTVTLDSIYGG